MSTPDTDPRGPFDYTAVGRALAELRTLEAETAQARDTAERAVLAARSAGASWADLACASGEPITTLKWLAVRSQPHVKESQEKTARRRAAVPKGRPGPRTGGEGFSVAEWAKERGVTPQAIYASLRQQDHGGLDVFIDDRGRKRIRGLRSE